VVDFDPDGGTAVFEPDTVREEVFSYAGVDENTDSPEGVTRPATAFGHAAGTFVRSTRRSGSDRARRDGNDVRSGSGTSASGHEPP
jgi:hypothetical protein